MWFIKKSHGLFACAACLLGCEAGGLSRSRGAALPRAGRVGLSAFEGRRNQAQEPGDLSKVRALGPGFPTWASSRVYNTFFSLASF